MNPFNFINFQLYKLLALMLTFNFQLLTFNSNAQAPNQPGAGNCLQFNGANSVNMTNAASLNISGAITMEAWVNPTDIASFHTIMGKEDYPTNLNQGYTLIIGNMIDMQLATGGVLTDYASGAVIQLNTWQHIAATYDSGNGIVNLYHNGVLVTTYTIGGTIQNGSQNFLVGARNASGQFMDGQIDEVRIWNTARTQAEIRDNMCKKLIGSEAGLVGYWRFDETSGNTAFDSSPNGNNGTGF